MATPAIGNPISFGDLETEFGGSNPITMGEYAAQIGKSNGDNMGMYEFHGLSSEVISITDTYASSLCTHTGAGCSTTATASFYATGELGGTAFSGTWSSLSPNATGADYDIRATIVSGTCDSGTMNTWLNLGSTRSWSESHSSTASSDDDCLISFEIRDASTLTVLDTTEVTIRASVINTNQ